MLDIGSVDFTQRAQAILEGEKAALAVMPQIRALMAKLQAERTQAAHLAQKQAEKQAAEVEYQNCLEKRSRLRKLAGMAGMDGDCVAP